MGIDLDGSLRGEAQYISKYREMAMHPEIEQAVEDICNESIIQVKKDFLSLYPS